MKKKKTMREQHRHLSDQLSYREQISVDLNALADKWQDMGMAGLAQLLRAIDMAYTLEVEGYLISIVATIEHLIERLKGEDRT